MDLKTTILKYNLIMLHDHAIALRDVGEASDEIQQR
jgi:hypothetical protein